MNRLYSIWSDDLDYLIDCGITVAIEDTKKGDYISAIRDVQSYCDALMHLYFFEIIDRYVYETYINHIIFILKESDSKIIIEKPTFVGCNSNNCRAIVSMGF